MTEMVYLCITVVVRYLTVIHLLYYRFTVACASERIFL